MKNRSTSAISQIQAIALAAIIIVAVLAVAGYYFFVYEPSGPTEDVILGFVCPLTGTYGYVGDMSLKGLQLAVDEINAGGGIKSMGGRNITIISYDAGGTAEEARAATERFITVHGDEASAIVMPWPSGFVMAASEITERAGIPMLCQAWVDDLTMRGFEYIFRFCPNSSAINTKAVPDLLTLGEHETGEEINRIAFAYDDNPATIGLIATMRSVVVDMGKELVLDEMWTPPLMDATALVLKIQNSNPDIFISYAISLPDVLQMVSKIHEMNLQIPICLYGGGILNPQFLETMGEDLAEGILGITDWNTLKGVEWLQENYTKRYGVEFMPKDSGVQYGLAWAFKEACEIAGSADPKDIRDAFISMDVTTGPAAAALWGRVKFYPNGDLATAFPVLAQWQSGKIETVYPLNFATAPVQWPQP